MFNSLYVKICKMGFPPKSILREYCFCLLPQKPLILSGITITSVCMMIEHFERDINLNSSKGIAGYIQESIFKHLNHEVIHRNRYLAVDHWSSSSEIKALKELHAWQAAEKIAWSIKCLIGGKNPDMVVHFCDALG